jgi:uncharacterized protein
VGRSAIDGSGLFARHALAEGEMVLVLGGTVIDDAELARLSRHSSLAVGEGINLLQADDDPARYGNHSCDPNLWLADEVTLVARRRIEAGEELTVDYATMTVAPWQMECRCGAADCRGVVTGDDWRRLDLQERYRGRFSPFVDARISSRAPSAARR